MLVSIESLGSDYVESFGGKPGLTPNLDRLARQGLMFTRLYATGLRTVRGLEALTLSRPVFAHVMTTSNHRPYTYPENRVSIPSGSGRDGAVAYTDWAIGDFMARAAQRPWFTDTVFVFVADHTSHGRGRTDLPPEHYRIPLVFYSPAHIQPGRIDTLASLVDVGPTLLARLDFGYTSTFFGQDILTEGAHHRRAFMANYLTVGYMEEGMVVELSPKSKVRVLDAVTGVEQSQESEAVRKLIDEAVSHYEVASRVLGGRLVGTARGQ